MASVSARIPEEDEDELEEVAELLNLDRSSIIRRALREGINEIRIRHAIEKYQSGEVSVNQASRIAGVSIAEWLEIANKRNLTSQLSPEDLEEDIETALDL